MMRLLIAIAGLLVLPIVIYITTAEAVHRYA